ncbi:hypothetical protein D3C79_1098490 [compost metagenome]
MGVPQWPAVAQDLVFVQVILRPTLHSRQLLAPFDQLDAYLLAVDQVAQPRHLWFMPDNGLGADFFAAPEQRVQLLS